MKIYYTCMSYWSKLVLPLRSHTDALNKKGINLSRFVFTYPQLTERFLFGVYRLRIVLSCLLALGWAGAANAGSGLYKNFIVLNTSASNNTYYYTNLATSNSPFQNADLGTFSRTFTPLLLQGAEVNTYEDNGATMTAAHLYYRVYAQNTGPSGSFQRISLPFRNSGNDNNPNNKKWDQTLAGVDLLQGTTGVGRFVLEVYLQADGSYAGNPFANYDSNNGANYRATFTISANEGVVPDATELNALRDFYNSTGGPTWTNRTNWLQGNTLADAATWYGVTVTNGDVTSLKSENNNIQGALPASIGQLTQLTELRFTDSYGLTGPLTPQVGQLRRLKKLTFLTTGLNGSIPTEIGQLTQLTDLDFFNSLLSGPIPVELGNLSQLQYLRLGNYYRAGNHGNKYVGGIPAALGQLTQLTVLDIGYIPALGGTIPPSLGNLTNLTVLGLYACGLTGTIPPELGNLTKVVQLELHSNQLTGTVPTAVSSKPSLYILNLQNNALTGIQSFQQLSQRQYFDLNVANNQLEFGVLEPSFSGPGQQVTRTLAYLPQTLSTEEVSVEIPAGEPLILTSGIGGTQTRYQWQKEQGGVWTNITGAINATYQIAQATATDQGRYRCQTTNGWVINLTLYSRLQIVQITDPLPPTDPSADLNRNWVLNRTFDATGNVIGESKHFADGLGRPTQLQVKNFAKHHVLAMQRIYNKAGIGVLSTLAAPINNQEFKYKADFITSGGSFYNTANFEGTGTTGPAPVDDSEIGTLGHYYSTNNILEPATAVTAYPYSLVDLYEDPIGGTRRAAIAGDELRMGKHHEKKIRQFSLLNELDHYSKLRDNFITGSPTNSLRGQGFKSVNIDANGNETISFSNKDGQILATCLTGDQYPASTLAFALDTAPITTYPQYQEIHIPASSSSTTISLSSTTSTTHNLRVVNIETGVLTFHSDFSPITLNPGFYRFEEYSGVVEFTYQVHYGDFNYTFYDDIGQSVVSITPKGVQELMPNGLDNASDAVPNFVIYTTYDSDGHVLSSRNTDAGLAQFVYREDGSLRFSQSAEQAKQNKFSYVTYDRSRRIIETGEYQTRNPSTDHIFEPHSITTPAANSVLQASTLENKTPGSGLDIANCSQRKNIWYDRPFQDAQLNGRVQEFVTRAVSKTTNGSVTSWYSYDELGRLTWMIQDAPAVGIKAVDYTYDFNGNILEVAYQKGQPDAFYHHYYYNADQRLATVYTSFNGIAKTLQAKYTYYLHGPLKRSVLAGKLQGVDYTYTAQGWLKGINQANRSLDPGIDKPTVNGVYKDLFGLTLDYFNGDYASSQLNVPTPSVDAVSTTKYDGSIRSVAWSTVANTAIRINAYTYDSKSQLFESEFGTLNPNTQEFYPSVNDAYKEGNLRYDANGNLKSLRRHDGDGFIKDDFTYQYIAGTNKLAAISGPTNTAVLDYEYDADGYMVRQRDERGQRYLTYDVTGKVTGVYQDIEHTQPLVTYAYNDRGFRTSKRSYNKGFALTKTTYYVRDLYGTVLSTYEQTSPSSTIQQIEIPLYGGGRLGTLTRQDDGTLDARYELNDQLGNTRVVFHRPQTATYLATMTPSQSSQEESQFTNISSTRVPHPQAPDGYVARLNATQGIYQGPSKILAVAKGDTVTLSALALFESTLRPSVSRQLTPILVGSAIATDATFRALPSNEQLAPTQSKIGQFFSRLSAGVTFGAFAARQPVKPTTGVMAWLHYRLLDGQNRVLDEQYEPIENTPDMWQNLKLGVRIAEPGNLELSVVSEDPNRVIYFDDVRIEHIGGLIVQEQHQYAYGSPLTGLNYMVGTKRYRHGYQGQFAEQDEETGYESFELRLYDARIGRWLSIDPEGQFDSPFVGMGNNPVSQVDPDGGFSGGPGPVYTLGNITIGSHMLGDVTVTGLAAGSGLRSLASYASSITRTINSIKVQGELDIKKHQQQVFASLQKTNVGFDTETTAAITAVNKDIAFKDRKVLMDAGPIMGMIGSPSAGGKILVNELTEAFGGGYESIAAASGKYIEPLMEAELNALAQGKWTKVYEAGILNGNKVEVHYFYNSVTKQYALPKIKFPGWGSRALKEVKKFF